jgi:hypothetical protein
MSKQRISKQIISLAPTRNELININEDLNSKCGSSYHLKLLQYRHRDKKAALYDTTDKKYDILLCLYHSGKCVSSVTGQYDKSNKSIELLSKTDEKYEGKKYNLYLRTIFIYLMLFVRPGIAKIISYATNPISTYTMYKHYQAINPDLQEYTRLHKLNPSAFTLENAKKFHAYFAEKYNQTPATAEIELAQMLEDCGPDCSVEDLGFGSKEEAIDFIITTSSDQAITLELDLRDDPAGKKAFLHDKLANTQIICNASAQVGTTKIGGGKFIRRKSRRKSRCKTRRIL